MLSDDILPSPLIGYLLKRLFISDGSLFLTLDAAGKTSYKNGVLYEGFAKNGNEEVELQWEELARPPTCQAALGSVRGGGISTGRPFEPEAVTPDANRQVVDGETVQVERFTAALLLNAPLASYAGLTGVR